MRGLLAKRGEGRLNERLERGMAERFVVAPLGSDGRGGGVLERRRAAEGTTEVSREHGNIVVQAQEALVQGAEDLGRAGTRLDSQVRPRDVADEEGVAGQHR